MPFLPVRFYHCPVGLVSPAAHPSSLTQQGSGLVRAGMVYGKNVGLGRSKEERVSHKENPLSGDEALSGFYHVAA